MALVPINQGLFAVLAQSNALQIGQAIQEKFPGENFTVIPGQWLLAAPGKTTQEVAEIIGITAEPSIGSGIILAFSSYFGRTNPQVWEWIAAKMGAPRG